MVDVRSIPACAGEPPCIEGYGQHLSVYPRVCGGTTSRPSAPRPRSGLSPRVRGNRRNGPRVSAYSRSIPACAGEPVDFGLAVDFAGVYPRVCGGTIYNTPFGERALGLSPRVRGNRCRRARTNTLGGSIPACAGEPLMSLSALMPATVYPRVCGGTGAWCAVWPPGAGLSPRVRGNRSATTPRHAHKRSIPACAGEPRSPSLRSRICGVYPRVCGGTVGGGCVPYSLGGLSPRVRGNLPMRVSAARVSGSIPACAGEPLSLYDHR